MSTLTWLLVLEALFDIFQLLNISVCLKILEVSHSEPFFETVYVHFNILLLIFASEPVQIHLATGLNTF
jgi:hypothetical protein